jgi:hypothetical protein
VGVVQTQVDPLREVFCQWYLSLHGMQNCGIGKEKGVEDFRSTPEE